MVSVVSCRDGRMTTNDEQEVSITRFPEPIKEDLVKTVHPLIAVVITKTSINLSIGHLFDFGANVFRGVSCSGHQK